MTVDEEISNNLVINKCPKCEVIGARRSWYPPILHTLTAPINFVASQLHLPLALKQYGPFLVAVDSEKDINTFEVQVTLQCILCTDNMLTKDEIVEHFEK